MVGYLYSNIYVADYNLHFDKRTVLRTAYQYHNIVMDTIADIVGPNEYQS